MAPRPAPAKNRDAFLHNIGQVGRKTGLTLPEAARDENGLETIDGMFSSPEKSPVKQNGTIPEPTTVLESIRRTRLSTRSTSPNKTSGILGSPRRTPGLLSSPRRLGSTPLRPPLGANNPIRTLDFSAARPTFSPQKQTEALQRNIESLSNGSPAVNGKGKGRADEARFEEASPGFSDSEVEEEVPAVEEEDLEPEAAEPPAQDVAPDTLDDDFQPNLGDDDFDLDGTGGGDAFEETVEEPTVEEEEEPSAEPEPERVSPLAPSRATAKNRSPAPKNAPKPVSPAIIRDALKRKSPPIEDREDAPPSAKKPRGRPPKNAPKTAPQGIQTTLDKPIPAQITKSKAGRKAKTAIPKDPVPLDPEVDKVVSRYVNKGGINKNRSLYILRKETPTEDGIVHTRSGRVSVRPLAYWRNERCVYGDGEADMGERFPLTSIKEIVRVDEVEPEGGHRSRGRGRSRTPGTKVRRVDESDEEEGEEEQEWEKGEGIVHGPVKKWDNDYQMVADDEEETIDIAMARDGIHTREGKDRGFFFGKCVNLPFLGCGFVDLPPGGAKKLRNSKRMHMVFFVHQGRVDVRVEDTEFSIGKGGLWQVPRGNMYSIQNPRAKPARIFFSQGCEERPEILLEDDEPENVQPQHILEEEPVAPKPKVKRGPAHSKKVGKSAGPEEPPAEENEESVVEKPKKRGRPKKLTT